jgi:hypothetical protein
MRPGGLLVAVILPLALLAHAANAPAVLTIPRQMVESADYRATGHLMRVDANGMRTSYAIAVKAHWFPGLLRVQLDVNSPPEARTHILLEMRPNSQNSIQIAHPGDTATKVLPFDMWSGGPLGPGFSYEDFLEPQYFWPGQTVLKEEKYGARDCAVLKSTPGTADRTHYVEVRTWIDHSIGFPVYVEKTLRGSGIVKEFTYFGLRQDQGVWSARQVEVKTRGQAGSTLLIIDRGKPKANLALKDFSAAQLTHF